ncbi:MAG: ATP synthase F0 subunit B [Deltaproteobacteria bacterium]|nr:ATP synthase F0 subunit B [Deltaproteobacteria bacterium]
MVELNNMIIAQMIAFIVLLFLLNIVLYKPILSTMGKRRENVESQLSQAEKVTENAQEKKKEHEKILENARANGKKLYNDLVSEAVSEKDKLLHETEEKLKTEIHKFNAYIEEIKKKELKQGEHLSDDIADKIFNKLTV